MNYIDKRKENQQIARERIEILKKMKFRFPEFAERYDNLIDKISRKYKVPKDL